MPEPSPSASHRIHPPLPQIGLHDLSVPHRSYEQMLRGGPAEVVFPSALTPRQLRALRCSVTEAFADQDPVRRLIVTVRAALLNKTVPQYAEILGIRPNTLSRIEDNGFDPARSVATAYHPFIADWRKRAQEKTPLSPFFRWAEHRLTKLLLQRDFGTPVGLLREWQLQVGSETFTKKTGIASGEFWQYRSLEKAFTFGELIHIGRKIHPAPGSSSSPKRWDAPWVKRTRQIYFHQALKLNRPVSIARLHMALEWAGISPTVSGLGQAFPKLSEETRQRIIRFEPIPLSAWRTIQRSEVFSKHLPPSELQRIDQAMQRESRYRTPRLESTKLAVKIIREQKLSTKTLARMTGVHDDARPRHGAETIRNLIFEGVAGNTVPWGALAAVLSRDTKEFSRLLTLRANEWQQSYHRRTGQHLSPSSLYLRMWGEPPAKQDNIGESPKLEAGLHSRRTQAILRRSLLLHTDPDPRLVLHELLSLTGAREAIRRVASSLPRMYGIIRGDVVPSFHEYRRFLQTGGITELPLHEIGWRELRGSSRTEPNLTQYGAVQHRIIQMLISERFASRQDFLLAARVNPKTETHTFNLLRQRGELPVVLFDRLLAIGGCPEGQPRRQTIDRILQEKDYPAAISKWFDSGLHDLLPRAREAVINLFASREDISLDDLRPFTTSAQELLDYRHLLSLEQKLGPPTESPTPAYSTERPVSLRQVGFKKELWVDGVVVVMRAFPGVTLSEISSSLKSFHISLLKSNLQTLIPSRWTPRFESVSDRRLVEAGVIDTPPKKTSHLPEDARRALEFFKTNLQPHLREGQGILQTLFPSVDTPPPFDVASLRELLQTTLSVLLPHTNLTRSEAMQLSQAVGKSFALTRTPEGSARLIGRLINTNLAPSATTTSTTTLTTFEALERLLSFFAAPEGV